jgi:hypothetical protein
MTATAKLESSTSPRDDLIGSDADDLLARKYTLAIGQVVKSGTVMGVVSVGGQVITSLSTAGDGSQTPFGVAAVDADASGSPPATQEILLYTRGSFNENALILGASHTVDSIREGLRDEGIYLETPVKRYP